MEQRDYEAEIVVRVRITASSLPRAKITASEVSGILRKAYVIGTDAYAKVSNSKVDSVKMLRRNLAEEQERFSK